MTNFFLIFISCMVIIFILINNIDYKEQFTGGLGAKYGKCLVECNDQCIKRYPSWLRGPINSGAYFCERICEKNCVKTKE